MDRTSISAGLTRAPATYSLGAIRGKVIFALLIFLPIFLLILLVKLLKPDLYDGSIRGAQGALSDLFYKKKYEVVGLSLLEESELFAMLPVDQPILWWWSNRSDVSDWVKSEPLVRFARVVRCRNSGLIGWAWSCFRLEVQERQPAYLIQGGPSSVIAANDGVGIFQLGQTESEKIIEGDGTLLFRDKGTFRVKVLQLLSPVQIQEAALQSLRLRGAVRSIEESSGFEVQKATERPNDEFNLKFRQLPFLVTFALSKERDSTIKLEEQGKKFQALMKEFQGRLNVVEGVDMSVDSQGIVKLAEGQGKKVTETPPKGNK